MFQDPRWMYEAADNGKVYNTGTGILKSIDDTPKWAKITQTLTLRQKLGLGYGILL